MTFYVILQTHIISLTNAFDLVVQGIHEYQQDLGCRD